MAVDPQLLNGGLAIPSSTPVANGVMCFPASGEGLGGLALRVSLGVGRNPDGSAVSASTGSGIFVLSASSANGLTLSGNAAQNNTKTDVTYFQFPVPPVLTPGNDLTVEFSASRSISAGTSLTNTLKADGYLVAADASLTQISTGSALAIATTGSTLDFTVPGASLTPGAMLQLKVTSVATEGGNTGTVKNVVSALTLK